MLSFSLFTISPVSELIELFLTNRNPVVINSAAMRKKAIHFFMDANVEDNKMWKYCNFFEYMNASMYCNAKARCFCGCYASVLTFVICLL